MCPKHACIARPGLSTSALLTPVECVAIFCLTYRYNFRWCPDCLKILGTNTKQESHHIVVNQPTLPLSYGLSGNAGRRPALSGRRRPMSKGAFSVWMATIDGRSLKKGYSCGSNPANWCTSVPTGLRRRPRLVRQVSYLPTFLVLKSGPLCLITTWVLRQVELLPPP